MISVAPMMACTDRHDRYFLRLIAPSVQLYTEMVTVGALLYGDRKRLLTFHPNEKYLALQLGGNEPEKLAQAAKIGEEWGYDEINLNVGCPSQRVRSGQFGACLMRQTDVVVNSLLAMQNAVDIPVTVKCRIGVDEDDSYEFLHNFITQLFHAGCKKVIIHARKAWLSGLSPKQNRILPPLRYDVVKKVKRDFPQLTVILNGGITNQTLLNKELSFVDGIMIGRAAYNNPYFLAEIEQYQFKKPILTRHDIVKKFLPYVEEQLQKGVPLIRMTRHILGLFHGQHGALLWRRHLSQFSHLPGAGINVIEKALNLVSDI